MASKSQLTDILPMLQHSRALLEKYAQHMEEAENPQISKVKEFATGLRKHPTSEAASRRPFNTISTSTKTVPTTEYDSRLYPTAIPATTPTTAMIEDYSRLPFYYTQPSIEFLPSSVYYKTEAVPLISATTTPSTSIHFSTEKYRKVTMASKIQLTDVLPMLQDSRALLEKYVQHMKEAENPESFTLKVTKSSKIQMTDVLPMIKDSRALLEKYAQHLEEAKNTQRLAVKEFTTRLRKDPASEAASRHPFTTISTSTTIVPTTEYDSRLYLVAIPASTSTTAMTEDYSRLLFYYTQPSIKFLPSSVYYKTEAVPLISATEIPSTTIHFSTENSRKVTEVLQASTGFPLSNSSMAAIPEEFWTYCKKNGKR
ncbi:uncharacterized protein O3C94_019845 [Discoglossus pictus]